LFLHDDDRRGFLGSISFLSSNFEKATPAGGIRRAHLEPRQSSPAIAHEKRNDLVQFGVDDWNSGPASSDSWMLRFLVRFADVFSPRADPFGDLPTKSEPLPI
jgi:hypothetical protein